MAEGGASPVKAQRMSDHHKILIVEDNYLTVEYYKALMEEFGYEVCGAADNARQAVNMTRQHAPSAILMDMRLAGKLDGVDAAKEIHASDDVPIVFITGSNEPETIERIHTDNPSEILIKPILPRELKDVLDRLLPT